MFAPWLNLQPMSSCLHPGLLSSLSLSAFKNYYIAAAPVLYWELEPPVVEICSCTKHADEPLNTQVVLCPHIK